ncbi:MAG: sensor histidine kinase [Cytophagales bacterium]|nr:sensor histidine kinase [Cytophagales bacterium]
MKKTVWLHLVCWLAFGATALSRDALVAFEKIMLARSVIVLLSSATLFYYVAWVACPYLSARKPLSFVLLLVLGVGVYAGLRVVLLEKILTHGTDLKSASFILNFWNGIIFSLAACGFYFTRKYYREEQNRQKLQNELLLTELAFLKSQMNPHFLYNSLNSLYSQALAVSEPLSKSILLLSDIMRYALEETDATGKVPLSKEITHLRNFIEMHRLRFRHKLHVDFRIQPEHVDTTTIKVLPFVLISLVENAFKHGLFTKAADALVIRLTVDENSIFFQVKNRIDHNPVKYPTPGVGLGNVRRMLALAYPDRHTLDLDQNSEFFEVNLTLNLP